MVDKERIVLLGTRQVQFPSKQLMPLSDCNLLLDDISALRQEMDDKGYLYIRGFHNREEVLQARLAVLEYIRQSGPGKLNDTSAWQDGVLQEGCGVGCIPFMEGTNDLTKSDPIRSVIEGTRSFDFFTKYFGENAKTFDYKWLRAMPNAGFTGVHVDRVYMGRGSENLLTMWTPIGDIPIEMGVLAVCEGSHRLPSFQAFQETYGSIDVDEKNLTGTGWFTTDPFEITDKFGGQWLTTDFKAGDALIFKMRTVHMSTTNTTQFARISCDTRWQPGTDPTDPRFMGSTAPIVAKYGLYAERTKTHSNSITMEELRQQWGL